MAGLKQLLIGFLAASAATMTRAESRTVDFAKHIKPILETRCLSCHNPNNSKGQLTLHTAQALLEEQLLVPGQPADSRLFEVVTPGPKGEPPEMPDEGDPLSQQQVELLRAWIADGAGWPDGLVLKEASQADKNWWAYQPLTRPKYDSIDAFVTARLADQGLQMNPPADRRSLIRRATYDLIGLPPTPEQVEAFVNDPDPRAYEKRIDRLLASPHYGERWGRHWLDVVRFGESNGYERNILINNLWPFRDYVIASLNADKPFDQFIREHLAGDVFGKGDPDVEIGSAFLVAGPYDNVGNQDKAQQAQIRANTIDEIIRTTSEAFLGLTLGCARCHDHKFDPIASEDYYGLYSTFSGIRHGTATLATPEQQAQRAARLQPLNERKAALVKKQQDQRARKQTTTTPEDQAEQARIARALDEVTRQINAVPRLREVWMGTREAAKGPFHVFLGGNPQRKGPAVVPASLSALNGVAPTYRLQPDAPESVRRQQLADWITHPDNPLARRVLVNRIWQHHFGTGIVDTPNDFGYMGGRPTHPELLDFLARKLGENGWRLKPLHRLIMTSQSYRQSSHWNEAAAKIDEDSRLLWRFPPRRLSAEEIRDTLLAVSGKLDTNIGGPGFRLYQYVQDNVATYVPLDTHGPETYRRAVYHQNARASVIDLMTDFDQPDCAFSMARRVTTTSPLQALTMLNHSFTVDMAAALAARIGQQSDAAAQVGAACALAYQRSPDVEETRRAVTAIREHGLRAFCRAVLNSSELIYLD